MKKIYIIGHKSPDLDSVASAIGYANLKNKLSGSNNYIPAVAGKINKETRYTLEKLSFDFPKILDNVKEKKIILVDHNEFSQAVDGIENAEIIEILDHHKVDFKYSEPIKFTVKPWGATATIIAESYIKNKIKIGNNLATLLLSAILVDTVITKSPTCTDKDKEIIKKLAELADILDWKGYGMELFKIRSSVTELSLQEIIKSDFKDFNLKSGKFGIGQVETVDLNEFRPLENNLINELNNIKKDNNYHTIILFITDIIKGGSEFLIATDDLSGIERALEAKIKGGKVYIKGVISRKKQVAPRLTMIFDK